MKLLNILLWISIFNNRVQKLNSIIRIFNIIKIRFNFMDYFFLTLNSSIYNDILFFKKLRNIFLKECENKKNNSFFFLFF
jgi:hypothetical protein